MLKAHTLLKDLKELDQEMRKQKAQPQPRPETRQKTPVYSVVPYAPQWFEE